MTIGPSTSISSGRRDNADRVLEEWKDNHPELYQDYMNRHQVDRRSSRHLGTENANEDEESECGSRCLEERRSVKPGITGYWQINGKNEMDY